MGNGASQSGGLCADFDKDMPSQLGVAPCFLPQWFAGPYWIVSYREGAKDGYALVSGGQPENVIEGETDCGAGGAEPCCKTGDGVNNSGLWFSFSFISGCFNLSSEGVLPLRLMLQ